METLELKKDKIYLKLKQDIISGRILSGSKMISEPELARKLGVGRITLRASFDRLEHDGLIKRIHGKGTFVYPDSTTAEAATIMVIYEAGNGFELPWHYIVPEITRCAIEKQFKVFTMTEAAINMFSEPDIKAFVKSNHILGIAAVTNRFTGHEPILKKLKAAGVPIVITHAEMDDAKITGFPCIAVSQKDGWEAAIAYLAGLGHRRIAVIGKTGSSFREYSLAETLQLLKKYHAVPDEALIHVTNFDRQQIIETVRILCSNPSSRPTAILCFSDFYAIYVYDALKEMNLHIPRDVAVMGICGYPDARLLNPPLSTIDFGYAKFAEMAVEMLQKPEKWIDPITGKGILRVKPFKLIKRESTESR